MLLLLPANMAIATMILCSNDEALISLFRGDANIDIYKQMASLIRNKPAELITADERAVSSSFFVPHLDVNRHVSTSSLLFVPSVNNSAIQTSYSG